MLYLKRTIVFFVIVSCYWKPALLSAGETVMRPDYSTVITDARSRIPALLHQHDTPGLAVVLVDGNQVVWQQGFGLTGKKQGKAVTAETQFRYGSASSLFVSEAVMNEVRAGRIRLEESIADYLPDLVLHNRFNSNNPTIQDLLSHHGGLPADYLKGKWAGKREQLQSLPREFHQVAPPRKVYVQSAIGYELLAKVVETTSGKQYRSYLKEHILEPAGIRRDALSINRETAKLARGHIKGRTRPVYHVRDQASSGLFLSAHDAGMFLKYVLKENIARRFKTRNRDVKLDLGSEFAYGWALSAFDLYNAGTVAHFSGESLHYQSQTVVLPEHKLAIAVLANAFESRELVDNIARDVLAQALMVKTGIRQTVPDRGVVYTSNNSEGQYATWRGYSRVFSKGKSFRLQMNNRPLFLVDGPVYRMQYRLFGLVPINVPALNKIRIAFAQFDNKHYMIARFKGWDFLFGEKVNRQKLDARWQSRLGNYRVINKDHVFSVTDISLGMVDGVPCISYSAPPYVPERVDFPFEVVDENSAVLSGIGRNLGDRIVFHQTSDQVNMSLSGFVARLTR